MKRGTYHYTVWHPSSYLGGKFRLPYFTKHNLRVEVVDETDKSYKVKFLAFHEDGRAPGTIARAKKEKVTLDETAPREVSPDREIKLPYKDD